MGGAALNKPHVLVIEDDPNVRLNVVSYLEDSGYSVTETQNGEAGMAALQERFPDVVLCDLRMPGIDGFDVLANLRRDLPDLPVVVVSGTGVLGDAIEALRKGAWDFVPKPIQDMAVLEHAINAAIDKARLIRDNRRFQNELEQANRQLRDYLEQVEQDVAAARNIQLQMMPPKERRLNGYRFSRFFIPSMYLSGDFIDNFVIDERRLGFYLADVSGHGVSSAFVTVLLKSLIHRYQERLSNKGDETLLSPAHTLAQLNRDLLAQGIDKYLTMLFGILETAHNRLRFSNGGHFPTPVQCDEAGARFIESRGPPVGLFPDATYEDQTVTLPDGFRLAFCSDGVLDALPERKLQAKRERLLAAVRPSGASAEDVLGSLGLAAGNDYPDDITLLIVEQESQT